MDAEIQDLEKRVAALEKIVAKLGAKEVLPASKITSGEKAPIDFSDIGGKRVG